MARDTRPRCDREHKIVADEILNRYSRAIGKAVELPIPIELIVEKQYALSIEWDELDEPAGFAILGALSPVTRTIVMNTRHLPRFEGWVGPERFTLAHELAHWVYDANPDQGTLDLLGGADLFCRRDGTAELDRTTQIREVNANKLAAHLLLPDELVLAADLEVVLADVRDWAYRWGVSQQTLRIKLEALGILAGQDSTRHLR